MPYGYHGRILHVDLTHGTLEVETPDEAFFRKYMGGSALGLHYVLKEVPPGADPLGPENVLVLATGVVTGAPVSGQSRLTAVAKSPLTGGIGDSQSGGYFPAELKFAGFDAIVIRGRAEKPVYLWIHDGEAELRDASHLWGKLTGEVEDLIKAELGIKKGEILQVGPAGEKGVRFAALINMANRANGRTGMGAVMGSKRLKAIVVQGSSKWRPKVADPKALKALARWGAQNLEQSDAAGLGLLGTSEIVVPQSKGGGLPTRNWESGYFEGAERISGERMYNEILKERDTCYGCVIRCKRVVEITEGPYKVDPRYGGPEYETLATFGSYCGVDNLEAIAYANQLCNMYGMDTISCGATIAWAMECFERGLITLEDTGGIELRFGNAEAVVKMTEMIAKREGFGDILAEGSARAAQIIGRGTEERVVAVKGQEVPAHMPHVKRSLGLIYAVNPFGADHQSSEHDPAYKAYPERMATLDLKEPVSRMVLNGEKVKFAVRTQWLYSAMDSVNVCQFVYGPAWQLYDANQLVEVIRAVTGWNVSLYELLEVGRRRLNMLRAFNAREGIGREQDQLPKRFFKEALKGGRSDGIKLDEEELERAKDLYYAMNAWDVETGTPTRAALESVSLGWVADMLGI